MSELIDDAGNETMLPLTTSARLSCYLDREGLS